VTGLAVQEAARQLDESARWPAGAGNGRHGQHRNNGDLPANSGRPQEIVPPRSDQFARLASATRRIRTRRTLAARSSREARVARPISGAIASIICRQTRAECRITTSDLRGTGQIDGNAS